MRDALLSSYSDNYIIWIYWYVDVDVVLVGSTQFVLGCSDDLTSLYEGRWGWGQQSDGKKETYKLDHGIGAS